MNKRNSVLSSLTLHNMFNTNKLTVVEGTIARLVFMRKSHVISVWGKKKFVTEISYFQQVYVGWPLPSPVESPYDLVVWIWRVFREPELIRIYHVLLMKFMNVVDRGACTLPFGSLPYKSKLRLEVSITILLYKFKNNNTNCHDHRIILFT